MLGVLAMPIVPSPLDGICSWPQLLSNDAIVANASLMPFGSRNTSLEMAHIMRWLLTSQKNTRTVCCSTSIPVLSCKTKPARRYLSFVPSKSRVCMRRLYLPRTTYNKPSVWLDNPSSSGAKKWEFLWFSQLLERPLYKQHIQVTLSSIGQSSKESSGYKSWFEV